MTQEVARTAAALLVGTELLNGSVQDRNLCELAKTLRELGISLVRAVVVGDELREIANEIKSLSEKFDVVFTSGGVGPTHDDVTVEAVALAFGVETVIDERMKRALEHHYGSPLQPQHLRMARVPSGACMQPGQEHQWPTIVKNNVWILPGIPEIFRRKLEVVREQLKGPVTFVRTTVSCNTDELTLLSQIDSVVARHPNVSIGSYPRAKPSDPLTKITFDGTNTVEVECAARYFVSLLPEGEPLAIERTNNESD